MHLTCIFVRDKIKNLQALNELLNFQNTMMSELKTRVDELKTENEYQLRLKDMNYNEKIKELTEKFIQEMESLKTKNTVRFAYLYYLMVLSKA